MDFNPTYFSHPKAADGFTLAHPDRAIREFWIEHGIACRKIGAEIGRQLGTPTVTNVWIPDGYKDMPVDRTGPRERLTDRSTTCSPSPSTPLHLDAVEAKLFGIGSESYVVGSHEFYLGYAVSRQKLLTLDAGHFHPTEIDLRQDLARADVLPRTPAARQPPRPLGQRPRGDLLDDELQAIAHELVRSGKLHDKIHLGLDYFDASINRVAAWVIGTRNMIKALLIALLEPTATLKDAELRMDYTRRLALFEELKSLPWAGRVGLLLRTQRRARRDGLVRRGPALRGQRALHPLRSRRGPVISTMQNYDNFINGKFTPSTGADRITCFNPSTGEPICTVPDSTAADVEAAICRRPNRAEGMGEAPRRRARQGPARHRREDPRERRAARPRHHRRAGQDPRPGAGRSRLHRRLPRLHGRMGAPHRGRDPGKRPPRRDHPAVPPAHRRDRRHSALELSLLPDRAQGRARAGHRQHHRHQAQRGDAAQRRQVLRADGADGSAAGRHQHGARARRRGRQGAGFLAPHRHGQLHGQRRDRLRASWPRPPPTSPR